MSLAVTDEQLLLFAPSFLSNQFIFQITPHLVTGTLSKEFVQFPHHLARVAGWVGRGSLPTVMACSFDDRSCGHGTSSV